MNNPELYIFVAFGFAFTLSWIVSRFSGLPIDLFNTSIGLLFGVSANLALMANPAAVASVVNGVIQPALTDYALLLVFLQFAFGVLIISSHFADRKLSQAESPSTITKAKEAVCYAWSFVMSSLSCYVMTVFFIKSKEIFAPIDTNIGGVNIIIDRFLSASYVPIYFWLILLSAAAILRYFRSGIFLLFRP